MSNSKPARLEESLVQEVRKFIAGAILFNDQVAQELGLNSTDLQCLNILELRGRARPADLARACCLTTGGVTVIVDRLEKAGYVRREANPEDRRSSIVRLVPARARRFRKIYRDKGQFLLQILSVYNRPQLRLILDFFRSANGHNQG